MPRRRGQHLCRKLLTLDASENQSLTEFVGEFSDTCFNESFNRFGWLKVFNLTDKTPTTVSPKNMPLFASILQKLAQEERIAARMFRKFLDQ